ncbi:hypothetical protein CcaCcLH18_02958 [Colletotrichum camelliae]|nr:hypothetical protein CcaCcLH18_02958 [Colletotrichum camelliae]
MKIIHSNFFEFIDISVSGARPYDLYGDEQYTIINDDSPVVERHIREHIVVSTWLADCITTILDNLGDRRPWWKENPCVDFCTLAFDAGLKPTRAILCQNNHGGLAASSDRIAVSFSSIALETVWKLSDMITSKTLNTYPEGTTDQHPEACIELHLDLEENLEGKCRHSILSPPTRLHDIIDYITLMVPLSLTDPLVGEGYQNTLKVISSLSAFGVPNTRQIQIHGFVALRLQKGLASRVSSKSESSPAVREPEDIVRSGNGQKEQFDISSSLLESFLLRKRRCLLDRRINLEPESLQREGILARLVYKLHSTNKSREEILRISRNWTIQENAIVVPCPKYVISVAFLTVALVAGGMACAFIIGERIPGVDPFNLTNFSWLVGGLSILLAKSMRVSDWTWRDFLSGRVSCRTVQELSDVTRLHPQDVLFFLLSSEENGILHTGGPFQKAFDSIPDFEGFSIDVKPNLQTLLASGIVLVDVLTLEGPALLWLGIVPGYRRLNAVFPSGAGVTWLQVCKDPPRVQGDGDAVASFAKTFTWIKISGLYNLKDVEFR